MHIAEGFLPPLHAAGWTLAAAPFVIHGGRAVARERRERPETTLLLGAAGAFTFLLSAIKLPSITGSSSHPTGVGLGAVLFRPPVMAFLSTVVLLFQALLLAHGGLTTLGANVFSMGVAGPWTAYLVWCTVRRVNHTAAVFAAVALADLATYAITATQLALAFPDPATGFTGAMAKFLGVFAVTQVPLAVVEGLLAVLVLRLLGDIARPELELLDMLPAAVTRATEAPR
ncbi:energy-coupling factor ABC transporter permease [Intrasporangium calvum]|uniref:energy-coupling factor ABC transporter permease n=1 Tax=Intrasporangium calvum TaxID=53358 RepID=UPI000DF5D369|nr:energy-coupling factor ABC transporter permease [Intrasporangium calvum]AXG12567.1 energy-coupling factor ABC transporter permease [Intrasporangium calvum]